MPKSKREPSEDEAQKKKKDSEHFSMFGDEFDLAEIGDVTVYNQYAPIDGIPTGSLKVDWAFTRGRGLPRGHGVFMAGEPGSGKSTLCMMFGISAVAQKLKVCVIPSEGRWNQEYACNSGMGMPGKDYLLADPMYMEGTLNLIFDLADKGWDLCIVDSATALSPQLERDADLGDDMYAKTAKLFSDSFRRRWYKLANSRMCLIFTSQLRTKIGVMYGSPKSRPGGRALEYYSSICVDLEKGMMDYRTKADKDARQNPYGMTIKGDVWKNSCAPPYRPIDLPIHFSGGMLAIDRAEEITQFGKDFGIFRSGNGNEITGGANWHYDGKQIGSSFQEVKNIMNEDDELAAEITQKIREQMAQR